jgi:phospholipid N-methyltransferase
MTQPTAPAQPTSAGQGTHHYVLTLQKPLPHGAGFMVTTSNGHCSPVRVTRHDVYQWLYGEVVRHSPELAGASVLFFDLQPNQL